MKKISILAAVITVLGTSQHPADAGLLGMPLNLKAAVELRHTQEPVWPFFTDDILERPVWVWECWALKVQAFTPKDPTALA